MFNILYNGQTIMVLLISNQLYHNSDFHEFHVAFAIF